MADSPALPIYEAIKKASEHRPRYLFRAWSPESGGNKELNTTSKITPRAFFEGQGPEHISDVPTNTLVKSIVAHLTGNSSQHHTFPPGQPLFLLS